MVIGPKTQRETYGPSEPGGRVGRRIAWLVAFLLLVGHVVPAGAQAPDLNERAAEQEAKAKQLYREGRLVEAIAEFGRALELRPRPGLYFNIGRIHRALGVRAFGSERRQHYRKSVHFLRQYLAAFPEEPKRIEIERVIAELEAASVPLVAAPAAAPVGPATATPALVSTTQAESPQPDQRWYQRWYVWVGIGALLGGGAALGGVLATRHGIPTTDNPPVPILGLKP